MINNLYPFKIKSNLRYHFFALIPNKIKDEHLLKAIYKKY